MSEKEISKARELYEKFLNVGCRTSVEAMHHSAIQSAIICVEELAYETYCSGESTARYEYWLDIIKELKSMK